MRFALASCQNFEAGHFVAYRDMLAQELDFAVHVGDYIYESGAAGNPIFPERVHRAGRCRPRRLPQPVRALPPGPRPAEPACQRAGARHLGRSRGRQQLRRAHRRGRRAVRQGRVGKAASQRLPGLPGKHGAATEEPSADPAGHAHLPRARVRVAREFLHARLAPVSQRPACRGRLRLHRPGRHRPRGPGPEREAVRRDRNREPGRDAPRGRPGELARRASLQLPRAIEHHLHSRSC